MSGWKRPGRESELELGENERTDAGGSEKVSDHCEAQHKSTGWASQSEFRCLAGSRLECLGANLGARNLHFLSFCLCVLKSVFKGSHGSQLKRQGERSAQEGRENT